MHNPLPALVLLLVAPSVVANQEAGVHRVGEWVSEPGARVDAQPDGLLVRRGTIRTARLYSDFVFRFEFRRSQPTADGSVLLRSRFGYGTSERGYRVSLTSSKGGRGGLGRISGAGVGMKDPAHATASPSDSVDGWHACEVRAERDKLTVSVDGLTVSSAEGLDEFTGYIALQVKGGEGIRFRSLLAERLASAGEPFGEGAHSAKEPGVALPRSLKTAKPFYPRGPHDGWIEGVVGLELVVEPNGSAGDVRVVKPLHPDLDEAAIASARQWRFSPGTRAGQPVPVIVTMDVSFRRTQ